jgi:large subunit ribosomal protein L10
MLTKKQKQELIQELVDKIKRQQSLIFTDVTGVNVTEIQDLRRKLRESEIEYKVAKKTLIDLALKKEKKDIDISGFNGSLALAFSYKDPVIPAKILNNFSKEHKTLKILGGLMEDKTLSLEDVKELAMIPSRDELLAKFIGSIKGPISGFVNVLNGVTRNFIGILNAIENK